VFNAYFTGEKMKKFIMITAVVLACGVVSADMFGTGANQFDIDFVTISGDASSANGTNISQYSSEDVEYKTFADPVNDYRIGKFEISNDQFAKFATNSNIVWTGVDVPSNRISWFEAAQFINYLNTSTGNQAAYKLTEATMSAWNVGDTGYNASNPFRNSNAKYFVPTENEWVKAAYWNGASLQIYATKNDAAPGEWSSTGGANSDGQAAGWNYDYAYPNNSSITGQPWDVTADYSPEELNGTHDMMGNVKEWMESPYYKGDYSSGGVYHAIRGGAYNNYVNNLSSSYRISYSSFFESSGLGFRVASTVPELTLLLNAPNEHDTMYTGQIQNIEWSSIGFDTEVHIEYSINNGQDWIGVSPSGIENTGSYDWLVPAVASTECLIRISKLDDSSVYDISDNTFEIFEPTVTVLQPNGGERTLKESNYEVLWSSNLPEGSVSIEYSSDSGASWQTITTTEDTGSYNWHISGPESRDYLIRISDVDGLPAYDRSEHSFTVYTCQNQLPGDINGDCIVDLADFAIVAESWLEKGHAKIYNYSLDISPMWTIEGQWEFGVPTGGGGSENGNQDPTSGYTGYNVYGVNLNGDYTIASEGPYFLTSTPFNCSGFYNVKLRFARWLNTDIQGYVQSKVEVSNDATNWTVLWENTAAIVDGDWQILEYDVSETADNETTVYFRWSYEIPNTRAYPYSGWNIDDIEISGKR
jgi:formylglycine-generating enzyme required for sulfatase activity